MDIARETILSDPQGERLEAAGCFLKQGTPLAGPEVIQRNVVCGIVSRRKEA